MSRISPRVGLTKGSNERRHIAAVRWLSRCPLRSSTSTSTPSISILDGACRIPALVDKAARLEMPAVSLTDHGSLAGAIDLYKAAHKQGVKPIIGCEVYVADDRHKQTKGTAHLTLLAETTAGYANLIKLCSLGYLEGYYYRPRVDWELLAAVRAGPDRALRLPLGPGLEGDLRGAHGRRRDGARPAGADLRPRQHLRRAPERGTSTSSSRCSRRCPGSPRSAACRSSRRATSTTSTRPTPTRTRRCSASSRATR